MIVLCITITVLASRPGTCSAFTARSEMTSLGMFYAS